MRARSWCVWSNNEDTRRPPFLSGRTPFRRQASSGILPETSRAILEACSRCGRGAAALLGGFQIGLTCEFHSGGLLDFGDLFHYGNREEVPPAEKTISGRFNTANVERVSSKAPAVNPLATNFAECTQQAWTTKRFLQFQLRLQF